MDASAADRGLSAYEALAPAYDDFTHGYQAATWTGKLEKKALHWGPRGRRLLDVGCGTGKSFLAMLERGWDVVGCDISPAMLEIAREKAGDVPLHVADVRELPVFGEFDLVWALNDTLNYVMSEEELAAALGRMRANLAPGGVLLFDLNTLRSMREMFTEEMVREVGGRAMRWSGTASAEDVRPGTVYSARFEVPGEAGASHEHSQRHFPEAGVLAALERAGLECLEVWGDLDGEQDKPLDEERHEKAIYLARQTGQAGSGTTS